MTKWGVLITTPEGPEVVCLPNGKPWHFYDLSTAYLIARVESTLRQGKPKTEVMEWDALERLLVEWEIDDER